MFLPDYSVVVVTCRENYHNLFTNMKAFVIIIVVSTDSDNTDPSMYKCCKVLETGASHLFAYHLIVECPRFRPLNVHLLIKCTGFPTAMLFELYFNTTYKASMGKHKKSSCYLTNSLPMCYIHASMST